MKAKEHVFWKFLIYLLLHKTAKSSTVQCIGSMNKNIFLILSLFNKAYLGVVAEPSIDSNLYWCFYLTYCYIKYFLCQSIALQIGYRIANAKYLYCFVLLPFSIAGWRPKEDIYHKGRHPHT